MEIYGQFTYIIFYILTLTNCLLRDCLFEPCQCLCCCLWFKQTSIDFAVLTNLLLIRNSWAPHRFRSRIDMHESQSYLSRSQLASSSPPGPCASSFFLPALPCWRKPPFWSLDAGGQPPHFPSVARNSCPGGRRAGTARGSQPASQSFHLLSFLSPSGSAVSVLRHSDAHAFPRSPMLSSDSLPTGIRLGPRMRWMCRAKHSLGTNV